MLALYLHLHTMATLLEEVDMKKQLVKVELLLDTSMLDRVYKLALSEQKNIIERIDQQELIESDLGHVAMCQIVDQMARHSA